ncbi:TlpA family protein disulfide reductase [Peribacillus frigoritolerans]|uniref:TlpA family protein disulfide reductase n=1 Tax=Peribacillus frigoritolerans TaxID=450367 RepID=UPI00105A59EA|nr:TlpA disulfide reductase family protein [Peribacillus frigoritolerans]TDL78804.1 TlpA family protein disulfide reductase [Peribacillus frigoritolerans]
MRRMILLVVLLCFWIPLEQSAAAKAPELKLTDINQKEYELKPPYDQPIVLNFWASWCGPCKMEAPDLVNLAEKYKGQVKIYAVNMTNQDSAEGAYMFAKDHGFSFPVLLDQAGEASSLYRVAAVPTTFFVDRNGEIVSVLTGYGGAELLEKRVRELIGK